VLLLEGLIRATWPKALKPRMASSGDTGGAKTGGSRAQLAADFKSD
jgi:hypothetical protein